MGGEFIFSGISPPLLVLRPSCSLVGVFISVGSSSLLAVSSLTSASGLLGSGVLTGSGSGIRLAADPVISLSVLPVSSRFVVHPVLESGSGTIAPGYCCWTELSLETV